MERWGWLRDRVELQSNIECHLKTVIMNLKSHSVHLCDFSQITFICSSQVQRKKQKNSTRGFCKANNFFWEKANMYSLRLYSHHIKTAQNANQEGYSKYKCCVHDAALIIFYFHLVLKRIVITHTAHQSSTGYFNLALYCTSFSISTFSKNILMRCMKIYFNYHCSRNSFNILRKCVKSQIHFFF